MSAKSTFQKVQGFIKAESLLDETAGIVIALSGGPDSMALLDIFVRLQNASGKKQPQKIELQIAHLNHQLRGKESDDDAEFVKRIADDLTIPVTIEAIDINKLAKETGKGIEETAREARYKFLLDTAIKTGCNRIATGHTMSDQAETFLMRLVRGAGLRGLASMRPVVPAHRFDKESGVAEQILADDQRNAGWQRSHRSSPKPATGYRLPAADVLLIRPLLCITREEVEAYCCQRKLAYLTDATNQSLDYTRNRIRHQALKILREINSRAIEHIAQTAEIIAADQDALDQWAIEALEKAKGSATPDEVEEKRSAYQVADIVNYPLGLQRRIVMEAIRQARAALAGSQLSEIETAHVKAIEPLLEEQASGNRVVLPDGIEVWREFDALVFTCVPNEASFHNYPINQQEQVIEAGGFRLSVRRQQNRALLKAVIEQTQDLKKRAGRDWMTVALDDSKLSATLRLRTRQAGEKVLVVGQHKIKKLKNLMIDHKIASSRRATWPVVATSDGQYVWSPGLPPAIKFVASDKTKRLAIIQASKT